MKSSLILLFVTLTLPCFSQNRAITGIVKAKIDNEPLYGVDVRVKGTAINAVTDRKGYFEIVVPDTLNTLEFYYLGFSPKETSVDSEKYIEVFLEDYSSIKNSFFIIGANFDAVNSLAGFSISNGFYEHALIHFEDIDADILYQLDAQTNFYRDYSFSGKLAWSYPIGALHLIWLDVEQKKLISKEFSQRGIHLSARYYLRFKDISLLSRAGYQEVNVYKNIGASLGLQKEHRAFYYGLLVGYYTDYLNYSIFLQSLLFKKLSCRIAYDRIHNNDFLNIGINLMIIKSR